MWSYDILEDETYNGRKFRALNIIDEYSREHLLSFASRMITLSEVVELVSGRVILQEGAAGIYTFGQRQRIHCQKGTDVYQ